MLPPRARLVLLCAFAACAQPRGFAIFDAELRRATEHYDVEWAKPRPELETVTEAIVDTCDGYVAYLLHGAQLEETSAAWLQRGEYGDCVALWFWKHRSVADAAAARSAPSLRGRDLYERLDLRSFPSSLRPSPGAATRLSELPFAHPEIGDASLALSLGEWSYGFRVLAEGDFTANRQQSTLVSFVERKRDAGYYASTILVVPSKTRGRLTAEAAEAVLLSRAQRERSPEPPK